MGIIKTAKEIAIEAQKIAEAARAKEFENEGIIAYVAMMADVDLPEDYEEGSDE